MGDEDHRRVEVDEVALEPLQRRRCRGGWWARRAAAGRAARRAPGPARRGSARRPRSSTAAGRARRRRSPARAGRRRSRRASGSRRRARVAPGRRRRRSSVASSAPVGHPRLQPRELVLDLGDPVEAGGGVLAQRRARSAAGADRAARRGRPCRSTSVPASSADLAGERAQQGRLAAAVAARQRHPLAAVELERDVREQRPRADVLGQARQAVMIGTAAGASRRRRACSAASSLTWKEEPQPQAATTLGLLTVNPAPWRPST